MGSAAAAHSGSEACVGCGDTHARHGTPKPEQPTNRECDD